MLKLKILLNTRKYIMLYIINLEEHFNTLDDNKSRLKNLKKRVDALQLLRTCEIEIKKEANKIKYNADKALKIFDYKM